MTSCVICANGTYSADVGEVTCSVCPPGSYCANGAVTNLLCPPGTYSNATSSVCTPCKLIPLHSFLFTFSLYYPI